MIERLDTSARDDAVGVLVEAFWDYPVMRFILRDSGQAYPRHIRALIGMFADFRFTRGWPVFATRDGVDLAGVALVNDPVDAELPESDARIETQAGAKIGKSAWERMSELELAFDGLEPDRPHYYVGMIGVRPQNQGQGMARMLMDEIMAMSTADPRAQAVCLTTEVAANLSFYDHLGFKITGEAELGDLHTWALMRPTP